MPFRFSSISLICLCFLAACSWPEPYILDTEEFNRESEGFKKPVTDRGGFAICYNTRKTTFEEVMALAREECAKFGKDVVAREGDTLRCSLKAPGSTLFRCVKPTSAKRTAPSASQVPASGYAPQAVPGAALPRSETVAPWNAPWPPRPNP